MKEFTEELEELLKKHGVYIVAKSNEHDRDFSVEIGFQKLDGTNEWTGRHHLGAFDLGANKIIKEMANQSK